MTELLQIETPEQFYPIAESLKELAIKSCDNLKITELTNAILYENEIISIVLTFDDSKFHLSLLKIRAGSCFPHNTEKVSDDVVNFIVPFFMKNYEEYNFSRESPSNLIRHFYEK